MTASDLRAELLPVIEAALDRYYRGDPSAYLERFADDAVYADVWSGRLLDRAGAREHMLGYADTIPAMDWEITDAQVRDVEGGCVIAYHLVLTVPGGREPMAAWNISEVLRPATPGWEVVHANIAWDGTYGAPPPMSTDTDVSE